MPDTPTTEFNAERFAALVARFDVGNSSEAEAMSAARTIRRGLIEKSVRFVDAMARADVMQALDAQLKPVREDSAELKAAFVEVTKYADVAREQTEIAKQLRRELAAYRVTGTRGLVNGKLVLLVVLVALALMIRAQWH
jgi:hypothetical protein